MEIDIRVKFIFHVPFTETDINVLMLLSEHHYDGKCKAASKVGGFIYGWKNQLETHKKLKAQSLINGRHDKHSQLTMETDWHELDTTMKTMENSFILTRDKPEWTASVTKMRKAIMGALNLSNTHYEDWQDTYKD